MRQFHQPIQSQEPVTILITSNVNELNKREITKKNILLYQGFNTPALTLHSRAILLEAQNIDM